MDALVSNAGIGLIGATEAFPVQDTRDVLDANPVGAIAMPQAVLPGMRERRSGTVVHVTSSETLAPIPLLAVYTASKAALSAVLAREVEGFGIRVREVLPRRVPSTPFGAKGRAHMHLHGAYRPVAKAAGDRLANAGPGQTPERLPAGADAEALKT